MFKQNGGKTAKNKISEKFLRTFDFRSVKKKESDKKLPRLVECVVRGNKKGAICCKCVLWVPPPNPPKLNWKL